MVETAIQLYSLRELDRPLPEILDLVGETSFDGVEFAHRVKTSDLDDVRDALERNDLSPAAAHVGLDALEEDYPATTERYESLGVETLIVPWLDPEHFESEDAVADAASRLNDVAHDLDDDGFELQYHNHDQEFVPLGDATAMDELLAATTDRVGFELDLGWATVGGVDPAAYVTRYANRISHVHFADAKVETASATELGEGDLDIDACVEATQNANVDWFVYEHDEPTDPEASLTHGADTLDSFR